ncbi:unnamed protein product [Vitrella brassicaformis CCMP3155]|uniref:Ribosomal protein/NADH dehydrogenase domain-containing protein n=1 Tax=Vitrella brassicaformis (strain CCMP3155) TaxID=1169540 RepID=A0A0G4GR73_VITBC|nr:unnamed protein product [Vitrella brassicaformis CCMP3155]|mmetsp:Transcript_32738/g.81098  ORF Transcript_32738/g.81098 Transcript_32738/m.81098 type:complete len:113 (-) Transcript_32738:150-488(-)|eukprot:CEM33005.1 unnamed protein product [Vitrella brassicaformis CCMP3155]
MSTRRLERVVLGTPTPLLTIEKLQIFAKDSNKVANDFTTYFLPTLRYWNPKLEFMTQPPPKDQQKERLRIVHSEASGGGEHDVNLSLYGYGHQLMQRILDIDTQKNLIREKK